MKKLITLLLALAMVFSLCACGGGSDAPTTAEPQTDNSLPVSTEPEAATMTKDEMLSNAEDVYFLTLVADTQNNKVRAKSLYCDKIIKITGDVCDIENDYVTLNPTETDTINVVIDAYLPLDDIINLNTGDVITVVGYVSALAERQTELQNMVFDYPYYTMSDAYIVD